VLINQGMRFPVRNGATTRYLSEPEVAAAYRERLLGVAQRTGQIEQIEASVIQRINLTDRPWLVVSLLPELSGDFTITSDTFAAFETEIRGRRITPIAGSPSFYHASVGHQRLLADGSMSSTSDFVSSLATELHTDGAGVVGFQMWDIRGGVAPHGGSDETLSDVGLADGIIGALHFLAGHARDRAQTSGMAQVRALVVPSNSATKTYVGSSRGGFPEAIGHPISGVSQAASTFASLDDLAEAGPSLVAAGARLLHALGQNFGVPELPQLTRDGQFVRRHWDIQRQAAVQAWALANGVEVLE
jgi:hypothetical protein